MCGKARGSQDSASKAEHSTKVPSLPGGAGSLCLPSSTLETNRQASVFPHYSVLPSPPYMVAEQGGLKSFKML